MSSPTNVRRAIRLSACLRLVGIFTAVAMVMLPTATPAAPPQWWYDRGVIDDTQQPNDYAAVNQGQVKFIAEQAAAEMEAHLPGGIGGPAGEIQTLLNTWGAPTALTNDFTAVKLGSLKALARPFYDRLIACQYTTNYPWAGRESLANNYAAANIGQVKNLFAFDLTSTDAAHDANGNGLPDWWERYYGLTNVTATGTVPWNSNLTYLQAFQQGLNPKDFYNGSAPAMALVSGNNQTGAPGGLVPAPLLASVADGSGNPLVGAPVKFTVTQGGGLMQQSSIGTPAASITVLTDESGQAKAFFQLPNVQNNTSTILVTPGSGTYTASVTFTEFSDGAGNSYSSPFDPSNVVATINLDGSADVSWTNNADPADTESIDIMYQDKNGAWQTLTNVPAGTTSYHIPAP